MTYRWSGSRALEREHHEGEALAFADWDQGRPHQRHRDPEAWAALGPCRCAGYDRFWTHQLRGAGLATTAAPITEKIWQGQVIEIASMLGWEHFHPWLSIRFSARGWPDLMCSSDRPALLCIEAEGREGQDDASAGPLARPARAVRRASQVHLWRPSDLDRGWGILR